MPGQDNSVCSRETSKAEQRLEWFELIPGALPSSTSPRLRGEVGSHRSMRSGCGGLSASPSVTKFAEAAPRPDPLPVRTGRGGIGSFQEMQEILVSTLLIAALGLLMVATAFLSGLFGMAGGLILIGVLLTILPLPSAMVLHAITQMASNGWRAFLWRDYIRSLPVLIFLARCARALGAWSITRYVPDKPVALLLLGVTPFMARLTPADLKPNPDSIWQGTFYGSICMGLMLMTGVSGPLMDTFFFGGKFDRRGIVATKATCQVASRLLKLIYFGGLIGKAAMLDPVLAAVEVWASMTGTTLARRFLEAMTDLQFRTWAGRLITTVAGYYILYGSWLLLARNNAFAF